MDVTSVSLTLCSHDVKPVVLPATTTTTITTTKTASGGGASEFVKKLHRMLEDSTFEHIVSWGQHGDSFVVKDMNDFTKLILPRSFKHSNFASFVRQLNKYDFHKVKTTDEGAGHYGEHTWEFRHPHFRADKIDSLDSIKRKPPAPKRSTQPAATAAPSDVSTKATSSHSTASNSRQKDEFKNQIETMQQTQSMMNQHIEELTRDYQAILGELMHYRTSMAAQDQVMQNLVQYLISNEAGGSNNNGTPFVPSAQAQKLIASYSEVAKASLERMDEISKRAMMVSSSTDLNLQHQNDEVSNQRMAAPADLHQSGSAQQPYTWDVNRESYPHYYRGQPGCSLDKSNNSPSSSAASYDSSPASRAYYPSHDSSPRGTISNRPPEDQHHRHNTPLPDASFLLPPGSMSNNPPTHPTNQQGGLRVFTVGHFRPRDDGGAGTDGNNNAAPQYGCSDDFGLSMGVPQLEDLPKEMPQLHKTIQGFNQVSHVDDEDDQEEVEDVGNNHYLADHDELLPCGIVTNHDMFGYSDQDTGIGAGGGKSVLRVRRGTYIPGWAVPPRVLLVEDDAVCRKLSSKFLQVFGCAIDVAVDGVIAVNKMNLEKYDLVLMDIVLPNLDGVSATTLIRQFDPMTPIISMTSNANPNEVLTYFNTGMNDVLPKPFTKEGLLCMLEKHLMHMKAMQQLIQLPRSLGFVDEDIQGALDEMMANVSTSSTTTTTSSMLPLPQQSTMTSNSGFRVTDQGGSEGGKRQRFYVDDVNGLSSKRNRFEEVSTSMMS